ncbi:hypothetical protein ES703_104302 [subsurface metagenome]
MMESPKSLTAVVHVKFHYKDTEAKPVSDSDLKMISRILDTASSMEPEFQELLVKFADHLRKLGEKVEPS